MLNRLSCNAKQIAGLLCCCFVLVLWQAAEAQAGWLIDPERFHASVHGQLSCQDCHGNIIEKQPHPDPTDVNLSLEDYFRPNSYQRGIPGQPKGFHVFASIFMVPPTGGKRPQNLCRMR